MASYNLTGDPEWDSLHPVATTSHEISTQSSSPYRLTVKQQPERAKAASVQDKDRKPIDPPPVLQLDADPFQDPLRLYLTCPYFFVQTFLLKGSDSDPDPDLPGDALMGNTCASGHTVEDDCGVCSMLFCLNDISVKKEGVFRLKFSLFKLNTITGEVENLVSVVSHRFRAYNARDFPGMSESTSMTRFPVDAGICLGFRKESEAASAKTKNAVTFEQATNWQRGGGREDDRALKRLRSRPADAIAVPCQYQADFTTSHPHSIDSIMHSTPSSSLAANYATGFPVSSPLESFPSISPSAQLPSMDPVNLTTLNMSSLDLRCTELVNSGGELVSSGDASELARYLSSMHLMSAGLHSGSGMPEDGPSLPSSGEPYDDGGAYDP